ncbi:vWA domain-containing protein [Thaumasiovibrio subtropicus]|uniref:vWA domain-containing protein n=1 Tax=Thaumasiovibrio subtropicus TaxID=1891207 RepID=UPI00131B68A9|nr:substrate-binding and VWA domain-containing protein [Thaumasiovibrio subtropicus]
MFKRILTAATFALALVGCGESSKPTETVTILAGSELKDIEPKLQEIRKETGIDIQFKYIGTLDGADALVSGEHYDLAWFSHAKYLTLLQGDRKVIHASERIGLSPVIPAVKQSLAKEWGWIDNPNVTWADLAEKARTGEFKYALTDPTASNSGFSTVMGVQAAFSGSSDAITVESIDQAKLKDFFSGQTLTSGSSGWLAGTFVKEQNRLDGLFNYESILLTMNRSGDLEEPLTLIYPKDGVVTADYPLLLIDPSKRAAFDKLVAYFKTPDFQQWMMENTYRRPVVSGVKPIGIFPDNYLMELPFPARLDVVNEMLFGFLNIHRKPNTAIFVLDISGSMKNEQRIRQLKQAIVNLTGEDTSVTGKFAQFRIREKVVLIPFNEHVMKSTVFEIDDTEVMQDVANFAQRLEPRGGTAIYDALEAAYAFANEERQAHPDRLYSVVLMTDGSNTAGSDYLSFLAWYKQRSDKFVDIRTFPVLFAGSDDSEMKSVAELTGGRTFDGRKVSLSHVFKKIRGYQ